MIMINTNQNLFASYFFADIITKKHV